MEEVLRYLVGVKTTGDENSYQELSEISINELQSCLGNDDWIFKIVDMKERDLKEYEKLNKQCIIMDLFDKEFDSVIHRIRCIELVSIHLNDYMKTLESETALV